MRPYWHNLFQRLQGGQGAGPPPGSVVRAGAAVASRLFGLGAGLRRTLYARGLLRTKKLPAPVVSVGNLTVGGTGSTLISGAITVRGAHEEGAAGVPAPPGPDTPGGAQAASLEPS